MDTTLKNPELGRFTYHSTSGMECSRESGPERLSGTARERFEIRIAGTNRYVDINREQATHVVTFLNQLLKANG